MAFNGGFDEANVSLEFEELRETYAVDIAMCIDATGSMSTLIDTVKRNALNFYNDVARKMAAKNKYVDQLRVRVIVFRDYIADGANAMQVTDFYVLPTESAEFEQLVSGVQAFGGGDRPEDGLEALAYAIKSDWTRRGGKRRHIIVVWTDDATHKLGYCSEASNYPKDMAQDFDELTDWWGDAYEPGIMDNNAKRLLIFAPDKPYWSTIADSWDSVQFFPSKAGEGLRDLEYDEILDAIYNSI